MASAVLFFLLEEANVLNIFYVCFCLGYEMWELKVLEQECFSLLSDQ